MAKETFSFDDLNPRPCDIELEFRGLKKRYVVKKFSVLAQRWAIREWGSEQFFNEALDINSELNRKNSNIPHLEVICRVIHFLLEDKSDFPTWEDLAESIGIGPKEMMRLGKVLLVVIGMSQPIVDAVDNEAKKKLREKVGLQKR